jgi:hypothetical protein
MQTVTRNWFVVPVAILVLGISGATLHALPAAPDPGAYGQQNGWEVPPQEFNEVQRRGYHDGVQGARKDYGNGRRPNVNNREEYRDPDDMPREIPPDMREVYRQAFRRGYNVAARNLWGGMAPAPPAPPPPPPPQVSMDFQWGMRGLGSEVARQGFRDGAQEARTDYQFHRPADPDDGPRYRNPPVPPGLVGEYRMGFMRGYTVAMSKLSGDPDWQVSGDFSNWQPPSRYSEMERRGFREGMEGARRDFGNHRSPDPGNRDEYRRPPVPPQLWHDYRRGFRRGYEMAALRLWGQ